MSAADVGGGSSYAGALLSAIGNYYSTKAQKGQLRASALNAEFDASMANLNARAAERQSNAILRAGGYRSRLLGAQYEQQAADMRVGAGAGGITQSSATAVEQRASNAFAQGLDQITLEANAVADAEAMRGQAVNLRNQGMLAGVSARNLRATSGTLSPWGSVLTSALGSSGTVANTWYAWTQRQQEK